MEDQGSVTPRPVTPSSPTARSSGAKVAIVIVALTLLALLGACGLCVFSFSLDGLPSGSRDTIALIHLDGVISGVGGSGVTTPEGFIAEIQSAEEDPAVKAILLRVDSPGGTVAASQEIAAYVAQVEKPVVVSVGDVGASGAYMVASQCDEIVASPTSAVGSIGVIMEIPNLEGLLEKVGVDVVVLTKGELKDTGSPLREMTEEERKLVSDQMDIAYDEFIGMVADGRDMPVAKVRELATGWVWMGVEAQKLGLVDTLGGYTDAVEVAAELGGIEGEPVVVDYDAPEFPAFLETLLSVTGGLPDLGSALPSGIADPLATRRSVPR